MTEVKPILTRSFFWGTHMGVGSQGFGPSSTAFPGYRQGTGREVKQLGAILDPRACKARTLATRLLHPALD